MVEEKQKKEVKKEDEGLSIPEETYMNSGAHIGTRQKTADIKEFIYKVRNDGLYIIDVKKTDERIKTAAKFLVKYDPSNVLIVSVRQYGQKPIKKLAEHTGIQVLDGRFRPGTLTNPNAKGFLEPELLILTDPLADAQALHEAENTKYLDLVIPTNNKGRRALALVYWLLTRAILKEQSKIKSYDDFKSTVEDFEAEI
jgi:small subunit ribosomal protein S2